jgi:hypothetical protein
MKYTTEEVRAIARRLHDDITVADGDALMASDMLTAFADSIERAQAGVTTTESAQPADSGRVGEEIDCGIREFRDLNYNTMVLIQRFAYALACKLADAEKKYGYSDNWMRPDWMDECRSSLLDHVAKGDPRDVAAYCAFLWHHGERTALATQGQGEAVEYFAADPAGGDFTTYKTLPEAHAAAEVSLGYAQEEADDSGWEDEPPQICYGIVLGGCVEKEGSRRPAPEGSDFSELVDYRLTEPCVTPASPAAAPSAPEEADHG